MLQYLLIFAFLSAILAIDPEQFKPCFERYDGHKLFDATPFHSEWRMQSEEMCLPFCAEASSRCTSIVYDKQQHICHYFTINGIETESIERNPKMVYLQVAERRCIDDMILLIESRDKAIHYENKAYSNMTNNLKNLKQNITLLAVETSSQIAVTETTTLNPTTVLIMEPKLENNVSIKSSEISKTIEQQNLFANNNLQTNNKNTFEMFQKMLEEVSKDKSNQEKRVVEEKYSPKPSSELSAEMSPFSGAFDPGNVPAIVPVVSTFKATKHHSAVHIPTQSALDSDIAASQPLMLEFERNEIRRHPSSKQQILPMEKPIRDVNQEQGFVQKVRAFAQDIAARNLNSHNTKKVSSSKVEDLPATSLDDFRLGKFAQGLETEACRNNANRVWLAVENSKIVSHIPMNKTFEKFLTKYVNDPIDCMQICKGLLIPEHQMCDSFTYLEKEKQCVFNSVGLDFPRKALHTSDTSDFSQRAFYRFCYPENVSPFTDCAEFLGFRDYTMEMNPNEIFDGLPAGSEGLSACIELCVLASDFRCKSAHFDSLGGNCKLFSEHSLSNPMAFKEHNKEHQIYFENGCAEGDIPQESTLGTTVQRVVKPTQKTTTARNERTFLGQQPSRIDFNKQIY